jgi:hypothetical protein
MANDAKLGLLAGVMVVVVVAVFFFPQAGAGPAAIPGTSAKGEAAVATPPTPPTTATVAPPSTPPTADGIWKFSEPRTQKPVSRDPLMWPR